MRKIDIYGLIDSIDKSFENNEVDYITSSLVSPEEMVEVAGSNANFKKLLSNPGIIKEYHDWLRISSNKGLCAFVGIKQVYLRDINHLLLNILIYITDNCSVVGLKQMITEGIKDFGEDAVIRTLDDVLEEIERRIKEFKEHYDSPIVSPQLRWNKKYKTTELEKYTPIIAINDLVNRNYVVCAIPNEKVEMFLMQLSRTDKVIAEYNSLEEMVEDGWRMGT